MEEETDAQKKEIDQKEPLEDMTPEGDVTGGRRATPGANPALDAQGKGDRVTPGKRGNFRA